MKAVEFEESHSIELLFDKIYRPKMTRAIEHKTSMGILRPVGNRCAGDAVVLNELTEGLQSIEDTHAAGGFDANGVFAHL